MNKRRVVFVVSAILAVLAVEWAVLRFIDRPSTSQSVPTSVARAAVPGGGFSLVDHRGVRVSDRAFEGRLMLLVFGYTACPDVCPTTLQQVATALDLLGDAPDVQPVFITLDPERDDPAVLNDYVAAFHPRLIGLTGSMSDIDRVAKAYQVYYAKTDVVDGDYFLDHSAHVYVLDGQGRVATYLRSDATAQEIVRAVRTIRSDT